MAEHIHAAESPRVKKAINKNVGPVCVCVCVCGNWHWRNIFEMPVNNIAATATKLEPVKRIRLTSLRLS